MTRNSLPTKRFVIACGIAALMLALTWRVCAGGPQPGRAEVRAVKGSATVSTNGGPALPLLAGAVLYSGAVIKTAAGSTVDLFLGRSAGIVRVAEDSTFALEQLTLTETGADVAVEVQLNLSDGEMYFDVNKLSKASRYEIKMPTGVAGIRGTRGRLAAGRSGKPPIVLLQGKLFFVEVSGAGGELASHVLSAPPAVYFTATDGVKEAPPQMLQQVEQELRDAKKQANKKGGEQAKGPPPPPPPPTKKAHQSEPFLSPGSGTRGRGD